jgi:tripartite-type tricarboxylate transporter receptor subunit TctC
MVKRNAMKRLWDWFGITSAAFIALWIFCTVPGQAGNYPDKPVTIISDSAPGSTPDVDTRFVAEAFTKMWGQQVVVVNHPGANGSIGARAAADATPDGYTLYMPVLSTFAALPTVAPNLPLKLPATFCRLVLPLKTQCSSR